MRSSYFSIENHVSHTNIVQLSTATARVVSTFSIIWPIMSPCYQQGQGQGKDCAHKAKDYNTLFMYTNC